MTSKKNAIAEVKDQVMNKLKEGQRQTEREMAKVKKYIESSLKTVDGYVRKNPEKASAISAGIGAALGAAVALLVGKNNKKK